MINILELLKNEKVEWKKLGEVVEIKTGENINRKIIENNKGIYPVINSGREPLGYYNKYNTENNPIGITSRGAGVGSITFQEGKYFRGNLNYSTVVKEKNYLNYKFLYYLLIEYQENIKKLATFQGIPALNASSLKKLEIPIPSLETQEKIVEILDTFTNYITELQSELQSRTKQYEYYRDILLSEEYLNKITKEMEEDRRVRIEKLNDICELKRGKRLVKSELQEDGEFPVYQNSLIPLGYYHESNFDSDKTFIISAGSAGEIIYSDREFWAADDVYVLMTKEKISSKFLYYFLLSKQHVIKSKVRKASVPRLSKEDIEKLLIPLPSLSLQNKIVKILDKFQVMLVDTKGLLPEEIAQRQKQYEYYREKLLTFEIDCDSTHARTHARTHVDIV